MFLGYKHEIVEYGLVRGYSLYIIFEEYHVTISPPIEAENYRMGIITADAGTICIKYRVSYYMFT